jgi:hypothetical protein
MQVNLNCNCPKPNPRFGMAIHTNELVNKELTSRIHTLHTRDELSALVTDANKLKNIDIVLFTDKKRLSANVFSTNPNDNNLYRYSESSFEKMLFGPLHFLKRVVKNASKKEQKIISSNIDCSEIIGRMKTN